MHTRFLSIAIDRHSTYLWAMLIEITYWAQIVYGGKNEKIAPVGIVRRFDHTSLQPKGDILTGALGSTTVSVDRMFCHSS